MTTTKLKTKIILGILVPLLAFLGLSLFLIRSRADSVLSSERVALNRALFSTTSQLIHQMQRERGATSMFLNGKSSAETLQTQRHAFL